MKYAFILFLLAVMLIGCTNAESKKPGNNDQGASNEPNPNEVESGKKYEQINPANEDEKAADPGEENEGEKSLIPAIVDRVVDGDTVKIKLANGKEETVRLSLIDTPETVHPNKDKQPFGPEASGFVKSHLPEGTKISIELGIGERDKYGRLLAYLYIDGKMLNEILLKEGLARVAYVFPPNTKYVDEFRKIQEEAQTAGKGIWSIENYVREEGFVDQRQQKQKDDCVIKGNINSKGEKIYHTADSNWYEQTKPEEWFCSESEAEAAGFRAPLPSQ